MMEWHGIQPGDVGFDQGGGIVGFLIRHFSHSPYAHCWVYHDGTDNGGPDVLTAEAYPGGLKARWRDAGRVHRVVRAWRTEEERQAILDKSEELVGSGYNYRELFRIVHYRLRKILLHLLVVAVAAFVWAVWQASTPAFIVWWVLVVLMAYAILPLKTELNPDRVICSNHVAQCLLAARDDVELSYPPQSIWPGRLERDLNVMVWNDWVRSEDG